MSNHKLANLERGGLNVWMQPGSLPCVIEVNGEVVEVYIEKVTNFFVKVRVKADPDKVEIATPKTLFTSLARPGQTESDPHDH